MGKTRGIAASLLCVALAGLLSGCAPEPDGPAGQRVLNVGMILGSGGLGDRSFNDSGYGGLQEAQQQYGIRFETIDFSSEEANLKALRAMAQQGWDLIIGIGYENGANITTLAAEYPEVKFASIDTVAQGDNVASIVYREYEGDFLMGVLAAMLTKSGKIGFIGGVDIEVLRKIESGFRQGVAYQDSGIDIISEMAGTFSDPEAGKSLALSQYASGVDVIYNAAGRTGLGVIEAAKETGNLTIGTSGDQRYLAPGNVVGNRPKRVDTAVLMLVEEVLNDRFTPGVNSLGLKEEGLGLGPFDANLVSSDMLNRMEELKLRIIAGESLVVVE